MNDILNPYAALIQTGEQIVRALRTSVDLLESAIVDETSQRQQAKFLREVYERDEAEFLAEIMFKGFEAGVGPDGKPVKILADQQKKLMDIELIRARSGGKLAKSWQAMNVAADKFQDAEAERERYAKRFRATEAAANLTSAMLGAASR